MTARGAVKALSGEGVPTDYMPTAQRKAPKETSARFTSYVVQWTLAKRRGKAAAKAVDKFARGGIETLLAPSKEAGLIEALISECQDSELVQRLRAVPGDGKSRSNHVAIA